uniref:Ectonucleotide pyrophosphatase/phosphodiesterase 7 n=1 Tax=Anolis carolinensis TaxID=28377 RepID=A0A803T709_ANOCA
PLKPTILLVATLLTLGAAAPLQGARSRNKLLLVSFDGFRWNYDQDVDTPNLDTMARDGVKAKYITPPFVTQTSPIHFTLLTGKDLVTWKRRDGVGWSRGSGELRIRGLNTTTDFSYKRS